MKIFAKEWKSISILEAFIFIKFGPKIEENSQKSHFVVPICEFWLPFVVYELGALSLPESKWLHDDLFDKAPSKTITVALPSLMKESE